MGTTDLRASIERLRSMRCDVLCRRDPKVCCQNLWCTTWTLQRQRESKDDIRENGEAQNSLLHTSSNHHELLYEELSIRLRQRCRHSRHDPEDSENRGTSS